jgi:hypothetical protein
MGIAGRRQRLLFPGEVQLFPDDRYTVPSRKRRDPGRRFRTAYFACFKVLPQVTQGK